MEEQHELDQPVTTREFRKDMTDVRKDISNVRVDITDIRKDIFGVKKDISDVKESIDFVIQNAATKEDLTQFKSDILTGVDKVLKQVTAIREEQIMKTGRDDRQDKRLERVETHIGLPAMN